MTKLNQFARQTVTPDVRDTELRALTFLNDDNASATGKMLWEDFLLQSFPEYRSVGGVKDYFSRVLASDTQNLADFLAGDAPLTAEVFYTVALQLLQFTYGADFSGATVLADAKKINLPVVAGDFSSGETVKEAWYTLLNSHGKKALTYLDELAARGFYADKKTPKPFFINGKSQAVFDMTKVIKEVVYVEAPLDTDEDGARDLLKIEIVRPVETNDGLKVPSLYTASPYNQGTNPPQEKAKLHDVHVPLARKEPNDLTYDDIKFTSSARELPAEHAVNGSATEAAQTVEQERAYSLNNYFLARGFAAVYSAGIGTKDSDGIQTCGAEDQTIATVAIIEWLTGARRAFTNRTDGIEIKAWWCNGKVAMTGRSYLGTLATAAATTGVKGLETIISEAAISNWYHYYRENGLVIAPGGYPGEDCDVLAEGTFSRMHQAGDYLKMKKFFDQKQAEMALNQDRVTGNYSRFWDERNYLPNVKNIKADIVMVHGLNDWNVKPRNVYDLWQALQSVPVAKKIILHQGEHIYINNMPSIDYHDMMNLWLSYKLYGLQNGAAEQLPDVVAQDNVETDTWNALPTWETPESKKRVYHLAGENLIPEPAHMGISPVTFPDQLPAEDFEAYKANLKTWENDLKTRDSKMAGHRYLATTAPVPAEIMLSGTPKLKLRVSSSQNFGMLSFQLVDYGNAKRFNISPSMIGPREMPLGFKWQMENLTEFTYAKKETPFKMITKGHINLQNRQNSYHVDDLVADEFVDVELELQPMLHKVVAGHQIGLVVYATDFGMTVQGNQDISYTIDLAKCELVLPVQ